MNAFVMPANPRPVSDRTVPAPVLGWALIGREEEELVLEVLRRKALFRYYGPDPASPPPMVSTLERELATMIGTRFALGVTSGSAALEVALGALGVGPGDEVILPAWSWVSCFTAIVRVGGKPVLAEVDRSLCLAPGEITRLRTARTKAALVVHFQGVAADLDALVAEARQAGIALLEDCAESPGASYRGRRVGSFGDIAIFSFQQQKTITSGEGGAVVTNDPRLYERAVRMHDLGQYRDFHARQKPAAEPAFCGSQFRMAELTGAVALAQLRKVDAVRAHCRRLSLRLRAQLADLPGLQARHIPDPEGESGFETYYWVASTEQRDVYRARLKDAKIPCEQMTGTYAQYRRAYVETGLAHAPGATPFPVGGVWPAQGYRAEDFPRTEDLIHRFIVIPVGVWHREDDMDTIAAVIRRTHDELNPK
ncbi:DegT/DnrJ/EryC1/StrS family aminotransferase [Horticoccus sp. 23ND18S-11]|uniref:DegT/DnrJ/EryC1/StrS family aminotransferase n=1 Tax=Horticoccus sp. 23ND18S-11 TaxID=3391832 RepID=UPI0039C96D51